VSRYAGMCRVTCRVRHVAAILIPVNPGPLLPVRWQIWWQFLCESQVERGGLEMHLCYYCAVLDNSVTL